MVQFQGKLCPFVSKKFNSDGLDPVRVGDVDVTLIEGFPKSSPT